MITPLAAFLALSGRGYANLHADVNFVMTGFSRTSANPIDSLSVFSDLPAIVCLFGARRLSQQSRSFFPELRKGAYPRIYEGIPQMDSPECVEDES